MGMIELVMGALNHGRMIGYESSNFDTRVRSAGPSIQVGQFHVLRLDRNFYTHGKKC